MAKQKNKSFRLFSHENLEIKRQLLEAARNLRLGQGVGDQIASAVIYASLAEYLADNLLENLRELVYQTPIGNTQVSYSLMSATRNQILLWVAQSTDLDGLVFQIAKRFFDFLMRFVLPETTFSITLQR